MEVTAREIADYVHGEVVGDENVKVSSVTKIESGKPGTLCFLANPKYEHYLYTCQASIVLINNSFEPKQPVSATLVKVENAYEAIASLLDMLNELLESGSAATAIPPEFVARAACKAAVKAHDQLSAEAQNLLLEQLTECRQGTLCPHGRPTMIELSNKELERRFGRK